MLALTEQNKYQLPDNKGKIRSRQEKYNLIDTKRQYKEQQIGYFWKTNINLGFNKVKKLIFS